MFRAARRYFKPMSLAPIIASSSTLEATGQPLFVTLGEVAFNLAGVFSEVEEVRRKITEALVMATQEAGT